MNDIITPEHLVLDRRAFLAALGVSAAPSVFAQSPNGTTTYEAATSYNNFYEYTVDKAKVKELAQALDTSKWKIEIVGAVKKPRTFTLDEVMRLGAIEQRIYRMRCVEGWSMVIPWNGFSLSKLLDEVEPTKAATHVRFLSVSDEARLNRSSSFWSRPWPVPYVEGLTLAEARHQLTLLTFGMYDKPLAKQSGAPVRVMVPWKYGFKSPKSIARIELVSAQPQSTWMKLGPTEYGFYSNVNPGVPHPRWSQATERLLGVGLLPTRQDTRLWNGYGEVATLYPGDPNKYF